MDKPDTLVELHRAVVEDIAVTRVEPVSSTTDFATTAGVTEVHGKAYVDVSLASVWFVTDAHGRMWSEAPGTPDADRERHFAIDLRLAGHPAESGLGDSRLEFEKVGPLPAPTTPPSQCRGREVPANAIPLPGRLTIHERLDRVEEPLGNDVSRQNVVIDFAPREAPALVSTPAPAGVDTSLYGPGVARGTDGSFSLTGSEPRIVWELTREEQLCVVESTVGRLLVTSEVANGSSRPEAETAVIEMIAAKLVEGVAAHLLEAGDDGGSTVSLFQEPVVVDPTGATGDAREVDARVKRWSRPGGTGPEESLVIQLRTVDEIPEEERLPESLLALRDREEVAFGRAGWAILRSLRASQIKTLCLAESDFHADEPCELRKQVGIDLDGESAKLKRFRAFIEPSAEVAQDLLHVHGRAEGSDWHYEWFVEFELAYRLGRGEVPREPDAGEPDLRGETLDSINSRLDELAHERCEGTRSKDDVDAEIKELLLKKKLPPQTIGVKPILHGDPVKRSDGSLTDAGVAAGMVLAALAAVGGFALIAAVTTAVAWSAAGALVAAFFVGLPLGMAAVVAMDDAYLDLRVSASLEKFVSGKRDPAGEALPLKDFQPTIVELQRFLAVYLDEVPNRMRVQWREPDSPRPAGDEDYRTQMVAGLVPGDDRMWILTVDDAVRYVTRGRMSLFVLDEPAAEEIPLHVARSSRGLRYLRTDPDAGASNNLDELPPVPP